MNQSWARMNEHFTAREYSLALREFVIFLFAVDSIGSIFLRGGIWFGIAVVILASTDHLQKIENTSSVLRRNLGFFLLFLALGGGLMYLLFGFSPLESSISPSTS